MVLTKNGLQDKTTTATPKAETPKENGKSLPVIVPAVETAPERKILSVQELLKRNEEINRLAKTRLALMEIYDDVTAFSVTESAPGEIVFEDMNKNEFTVKNFLVIGKLVEVAKATLKAEMQKLDEQILILQ